MCGILKNTKWGNTSQEIQSWPFPIQIINKLQFNETIKSIPHLDNIVVLKNGKFVYIENNQPYKADLKKGVKTRIKRRPSKDEKGMGIISSKTIEGNKILVFYEDFSTRILTMAEDNVIWQTLGFLCPFCLKLFMTHQGLHKEHLSLHIGPVKCSGCEVVYWFNYCHFALHEMIFRFSWRTGRSWKTTRKCVSLHVECVTKHSNSNPDIIFI